MSHNFIIYGAPSCNIRRELSELISRITSLSDNVSEDHTNRCDKLYNSMQGLYNSKRYSNKVIGNTNNRMSSILNGDEYSSTLVRLDDAKTVAYEKIAALRDRIAQCNAEIQCMNRNIDSCRSQIAEIRRREEEEARRRAEEEAAAARRAEELKRARQKQSKYLY